MSCVFKTIYLKRTNYLGFMVDHTRRHNRPIMTPVTLSHLYSNPQKKEFGGKNTKPQVAHSYKQSASSLRIIPEVELLNTSPSAALETGICSGFHPPHPHPPGKQCLQQPYLATSCACVWPELMKNSCAAGTQF